MLEKAVPEKCVIPSSQNNLYLVTEGWFLEITIPPNLPDLIY